MYGAVPIILLYQPRTSTILQPKFSKVLGWGDPSGGQSNLLVIRVAGGRCTQSHTFHWPLTNALWTLCVQVKVQLTPSAICSKGLVEHWYTPELSWSSTHHLFLHSKSCWWHGRGNRIWVQEVACRCMLNSSELLIIQENTLNTRSYTHCLLPCDLGLQKPCWRCGTGEMPEGFQAF